MTTDFATYIAGLPRILAGANMLFRSADGRVLLVEPNYRETWTLPGGTIESDENETPRQAARRESLEEVGLDVEPGALLVMGWTTAGPPRPPSVTFLFDGGVLTDEQIASIRVQESELDSWKLVDPAEVDRYLTPHGARSVRAAVEGLASGRTPVELVDGLPGGA
ncbi:NUDIX domain-containing protein [Streptomyces sp. NRRL F-5123]|uniref:NUDIX domain-containing protein n=1 Tax=Streptomyces sp. NRRL F-5123 TaxID=1463856 RepID=UPI0004E17D94|nr:NUDIX hydrolase [Streptomyces sp. NRRL F-5123]